MKSKPTGSGESILASQYNSVRDDGRGSGFMLAHHMFGTLALGTEPTNGQVIPVVINGTTVTVTAVTAIGSTANNVLIGGSALAFATNLVNFLRRPDLTSSTQVAASSANQQLLQYVGWDWPGSSTNIVPYSLNKNVNGANAPLTSFNITGITVTSGTWTANTMALYIEDGTYYVGTTRVLYTGGVTPTFTAPVSHPRIDLVTADSTGTVALVTGTESVSPTAPSYPANKIVICEVYNVVGETAIYDNEDQQAGQGYIYNDVRPIVQPAYIGASSQVASGLFIADPGSEAQGDVLYYNGASWALLAPGVSGQALVTKGASANPIWSSVSGILHSLTSPVTQTLVNAASTFDSFTVPANTLGTTHVMDGYYVFSQIASVSGTITININYGGTAIGTVTSPSQGWGGLGLIFVRFKIFAAGSTSSQIGFLELMSIGTNGLFSTTTDYFQFNQGSASVNSTSNQTLSITATCTDNSNSTASTLQAGYVTLL